MTIERCNTQLIPDLTTARFDAIIDKMLAHGFIEEQNGVCHWKKNRWWRCR